MASTLTPSQAIRSAPRNPTSSSNADSNSNPSSSSNITPAAAAGGGEKPTNRKQRNAQKRKNRLNRKKKEKAPPAADGKPAPNDKEENPGTEGASKKKNRPRNNKKKGNNNNKQGENQEGNEQPANGNGNNPQKNKKKNNKNNKKKNNNKRFPWRKLIPEDAVDPITLEELNKLHYPPFALRAAGPYLPPPVWPPVEEKNNSNNQQAPKEEDAKERERRLLQEQWGKAAGVEEEDTKLPAAEATVETENPKHLNLFDGRALAYYMVSQLQFIDPLNRRDLTRDELIHLDQYLRRHNFRDLNVVEAYDTKGVSLSSAGAASTTAAGRAEILQQEARVLLNALFGGNNGLPAANNNSGGNALMQQYSNYQAAQDRQEQQRPAVPARAQANNNHRNFSEDAEMGRGIYGDEDGGMMVIDDDLNPSMRGATGEVATRQYQPQPTLWAAGHISSNSNASNLQPQNFPALSTAATLPPSHSHLNSSAPAFVPPGSSAASTPAQPQARPKAAPKPKNKKPLPPVKSLNFITKSVKKTTPEETQRQFEAREEARRKAMLSNLTFGSNPASWAAADMPVAPSSMPAPTEGQLERNRNLADAFGLTNPRPTTTSWARPTEINASQVVLYPDELILRAREKMGVIIKLEKKWKAFLQDEKAASLPLNHMDRETRALTHEYSDFWKLNTESFDAEPKRYIHCVKLLDTQMPYPLLSDAARDWRGPTGFSHLPLPEHPASQQTAGQGTRGAVVAELPSNPRAAALTSERSKLELKERTLPTELPPFQPPATVDSLQELEEESEEQKRRRREKMEAQKQREREREERKQKALEAAFASDDEEESLAEMGELDADSDWEEGEALYNGSDDEEEKEE